jgi:acetyl-CoA acetyltransferase
MGNSVPDAGMAGGRPWSAGAAIAGLGASAIGRVYGQSAAEFAAQAVRTAVADAGLRMADVDGVLMSSGMSQDGTLVAASLGLRDLRLSANIATAGASAGAAVQFAAMAVQAGLASTVVYVHSDCPLRAKGQSAGAAYGEAVRRRAPSGVAAMDVTMGLGGATAAYGLAARRHMKAFGTTSEQLGAIAVAQRAWATMNPIAQMREPITIEDHQKSRWVVEPLHLLDCCLVSNGAIAVVITTADQARHLAQPPVYIWGWGQCHPGYTNRTGSEFGLRSGAAAAGKAAFKMAGIDITDIGVRELYDCYTFTVLLSLEDYGFAAKGDGGPLAASGALGPGGHLPTNTGGGQLSSFYLWGATPLHEAVIQARGQAGARQVADHDFVLCSGNGGILDHHATLILGANPRD